MKQPKPPKPPHTGGGKGGGAGGGKGGGGKGGAGAGKGKAPPPWRPVSVAHQRQQHRAAVKAARARAKHPSPPKTPAKKHPRGLALGAAVACCAAEALAASLRLSGCPVADTDVLALYRHTADSPDTGALIQATLEAAAEHGLSGARPAAFQPVDLDDPAAVILGLALPAGPHAVCDDGTCWWSWGQQWSPRDFPGAVAEEAWAVTW